MDKQIDEMARILTLCPRNTCVGCGMECIDYRMAKAIYNAGYRKIPENAVVLDKKVFERIKAQEYINGKQDGGKETAEKFAERLKAYIDSNEVQTAFFGRKCFIDKETVDEICKEILEGK